MRKWVNDPGRMRVCTCGHNKQRHYSSVQTPQAPCTDCPCKAFKAEATCPSCNHGKSQHHAGRCHNGCQCTWKGGGSVTNLSLFDLRPVSLAREPEPITPMQKGAGSAGRPVDAGDAHSLYVRVPSTLSSPAAWGKSDGTDGVRRARGSEIPVYIRAIAHKAGGFSELQKNSEGQVIGLTGRTFRLLELEDGRYLREWSDGVVDDAPPAVSSVYVEDGIRFGYLKVFPSAPESGEVRS